MRYRWALIFTVILCLLLPSTRVYAAHTAQNNYTYDFWGDAKRSLPAFEYVSTLDGSTMGSIPLESVDDVYVSKNRMFLVDSTQSRVDVFDKDLKFITSIKAIKRKNGKIVVNKGNKQLILNKPEGVFYDEASGELYVSDTGAGKIIVLDGKSYSYKRTVSRPQNMVGSTQFKPSKLVVNRDGVINVVVQGSYEGIIQINKDGSFSRYFGLNKPKVNLVDYFWKSIATNKQKKKMKKVFAPSFNNVTIDSDGLIYATTSDSSAQDKVFRFNSKGENVLMQNGFFPVVGDLPAHGSPNNTVKKSKFVDVAVNAYGVYALLDKTNGRIFLYNFEGDLMNIFGSKGYLKGDLQDPTAISWFGDKLIVTDKALGCAYIFQPTRFGQAALDAEKEYYKGKWKAASKDYEAALKLNSNYDLAYTGVGRNYLMQDEYKKAMHDFKLGNNRGYFSEAFNGYRSLFIQKYFIWFAILFLIFAGALFYSEYKYNKKSN